MSLLIAALNTAVFIESFMKAKSLRTAGIVLEAEGLPFYAAEGQYSIGCIMFPLKCE